jgi:tetratricopeptide (TPR) repeat protein
MIRAIARTSFLSLLLAVPTHAQDNRGLAARYDSVAGRLMSTEHYARARDTLKLAAQLDPSRASVAQRLGTIAIELGDFGEAMRYLATARRLDSASVNAVYWTAAAYIMNGDEGGARPYMDRLATLRGGAARVDLLQAFAHLAAGRANEAAQAAQRIIAAGTSAVFGHGFAGDAAVLAGKLEEAKMHYEQALAADSAARVGPTGHLVTTSLAYVQRKLGKTAESDALLKRSMSANHARLAEGRDSQGYPYDIAAVYAIQGNNAEALKWLSKAVDAGWRKPAYTSHDPLLSGLRNEKEFTRLLSRIETLTSRTRSTDSIDKL